MGIKEAAKNKDVLVGVLKSRDDLGILLKQRWYRIPAGFVPKRSFKYIAFYQPVSFGKAGKRIKYYARVTEKRKAKRIKLLPEQSSHPRAHNDYLKLEFKKIIKLPRPIRNIIPRRVSFGFTDLKTLQSAKDILELYDVPPTEQIVERQLNRIGVKTIREYSLSKGGKRYRIDIAILGGNRKTAVECDNEKAHGTKAQIKKDKIKDTFLRRNGWRVVRLKEREIIEHIDNCIRKISLVEKPRRKR